MSEFISILFITDFGFQVSEEIVTLGRMNDAPVRDCVITRAQTALAPEGKMTDEDVDAIPSELLAQSRHAAKFEGASVIRFEDAAGTVSYAMYQTFDK